jgi:hypothetical protein
MQKSMVGCLGALLFAAGAQAQEIVEVPASRSGVVLPEDLFALPQGQWFVAKQVSQADAPCEPQACEAGFTSGDLVVSAEHASEFVRVIAGFRGCAGVAFQEVETGTRPGKYMRGKVRDAVTTVVRAAEKSCKVTAPRIPELDVSALFPRDSK